MSESIDSSDYLRKLTKEEQNEFLKEWQLFYKPKTKRTGEHHPKDWYVAQVVELTNERNRLRCELEALNCCVKSTKEVIAERELCHEYELIKARSPTISQAVKMLVRAVMKGRWNI